MKTLVTFLLIVSTAICFAELKVATLHPLVGDLARQIGGEKVLVVEIGYAGMDVHSFAPSAGALKEMGDCDLVIASGKGLERYLSDLQDSLGAIAIFELGKDLPSITIAGGDALHACCPDHSDGAVDPHWWHDVSLMRRAARLLEKEFSARDATNADYYKLHSKEVRENLQKLDRWVKAELAELPESQRKLVTAHAAFGYFCKAYRMEPVFVLGLSGDHEVPAKQLAKEVSALRNEGVRAVFPEAKANPKVLAQIAKQTGAKVGRALIADGATDSYEDMIRGNVTSIVLALKGVKE